VFNLQGSEIIIVLLLALVVLGPEKLPEAMRKAGKMYGELRKVSSGFQDEFRKAVQEPIDEVKSTASLLRDSVDLNKLASDAGDKPKTAEMAPVVAPADPAAEPTANTPTFDSLDAADPADPPSAAPADDPTADGTA